MYSRPSWCLQHAGGGCHGIWLFLNDGYEDDLHVPRDLLLDVLEGCTSVLGIGDSAESGRW